MCCALLGGPHYNLNQRCKVQASANAKLCNSVLGDVSRARIVGTSRPGRHAILGNVDQRCGRTCSASAAVAFSHNCRSSRESSRGCVLSPWSIESRNSETESSLEIPKLSESSLRIPKLSDSAHQCSVGCVTDQNQSTDSVVALQSRGIIR